MRLSGFILAAAVLAGACSDGGTRPDQVLVATDTADQTMYGMETLIEDAGRRKNRVLADTAYLYESSQVVEFRTLTVEFFDPKGNATATLTARQGTYWPQQRQMEAREDVHVAFTGLSPERIARLGDLVAAGDGGAS